MASTPANKPPAGAGEITQSLRAAWESRPLGELIRHIVERHHAWLRAELPETGRLLRQEIETAGRERSQGLIEAEKLFQRFQREIEDHLKKEEVVLFPLIARMEAVSARDGPRQPPSFGSIRNPVQFMVQDHELADQWLSKIKELIGRSETTAEPSGARQVILERLAAVEADLAAHVRLEDEILFPRAIRLDEEGRSSGE
ncbi:MAG TPA: hemerythrin domain-containing protein [Candidatus Acidoferrales bacterium]|nr:hemerythrin domain-containing protein [Candidatus Acidoferrales bacterium]